MLTLLRHRIIKNITSYKNTLPVSQKIQRNSATKRCQYNYTKIYSADCRKYVHILRAKCALSDWCIKRVHMKTTVVQSVNARVRFALEIKLSFSVS